MDRLRRWAAGIGIVAGLAGFSPLLTAQDTGRDGIARNLLERQQHEQSFGAKLYDSPSRTVPGGGGASATLAEGARRQLDDSQLRRLLQLELQNKNVEEAVRQQQIQIQQLQFNREDQAQHLHEQIQRDTRGSMQQLR